MRNKLKFDYYNTSCKYLISGSHIAFTEIDLDNQLIYLHNGGSNPIPVRLSDVSDIGVTGEGELVINGNQYEYKKWSW